MEGTELMTKEERMKNLWKRPEGKLGIITGIGLFGGILFGLYKILPFLVAIATNMIWLVVELFVLVVLLAIVLNKDTWRNLSLIWYQINRKLLGLIVDIDPISILRKGIAEMEKNIRIVHDKVTELGGILEGMKTSLVNYTNDFEANITKKRKLEEKLSSAGKLSDKERMKYQGNLNLVNNDITRGQDRISRQKARIETSEKYYEMMQKLEIIADYKVRDAKSELSCKEEEFEQAKKQRAVMKSVMGILKGNVSAAMEQEMALSSINTTVYNSIAEMQRLIDGSNDLLVNFEIDNEVKSDRANEILRMYDEHGLGIFENQTSALDNSNIKKALTGRKAEPVLVEVVEEEKPKRKSAYFN